MAGRAFVCAFKKFFSHRRLVELIQGRPELHMAVRTTNYAVLVLDELRKHGGLRPEDFVRAVSPDYALISVGARNRYGHPDPAVLGRLERAGTRVFRTDRHGSVVLTGRSDGTVTVSGGR